EILYFTVWSVQFGGFCCAKAGHEERYAIAISLYIDIIAKSRYINVIVFSRSEQRMNRAAARIRVPADVGLALEQARLSQGLSQAELASRLGMPQSTVSQMETGAGTIYLRRLLEMCRELELDLSASWEAGDAPAG
ncbi:MAG: helix-turn-helix domain-containing protein, partial [Microbacterium sp.]